MMLESLNDPLSKQNRNYQAFLSVTSSYLHHKKGATFTECPFKAMSTVPQSKLGIIKSNLNLINH